MPTVCGHEQTEVVEMWTARPASLHPVAAGQGRGNGSQPRRPGQARDQICPTIGLALGKAPEWPLMRLPSTRPTSRPGHEWPRTGRRKTQMGQFGSMAAVTRCRESAARCVDLARPSLVYPFCPLDTFTGMEDTRRAGYSLLVGCQSIFARFSSRLHGRSRSGA